MKTMYKIAVHGFDGYRGSEFSIRPTLFNTVQAVQNYANAKLQPSQWVSGKYQVIECTMDEATFTYTERVLLQDKVE